MTSNRRKSEAEEATRSAKGADTRSQQKPQEGIRETVEAVAIAFILAFVFKTFEAEAFVIPTGSMAPTLLGRHKEVACAACRYEYVIGASQEIDQESGILSHNDQARVKYSWCPNCRFRNQVTDAPVFNGDRIVVNKQVLAYRRFDVVVFKNPEEPHINYIKRLVGLPGETVRVRQGDIQVRRSDAEPWVIQRKDDPEKQRDIQLVVYDDRFPARDLLKAGAEERWVPAGWNEADTSMGGWSAANNAWTPDSAARTYTADAGDEQLHWLRYRHLVPSENAWDTVERGGTLKSPLKPQLVADFCGFNCESGDFTRPRHSDDNEMYWTNDLTLECSLSIESASSDSQLLFELVEGFRTVRCQVNPATGTADVIVISREEGQANAEPQTVASVQTEIQGPGDYTIAFANVDDRLCLWVNDELIPLGPKAEFQSTEMNLPTDLDLAPIGIAVRGVKATVSDLLVRRDIYYRNDVYVRGSITATEIDSGAQTTLSESLDDPREYSQKYVRLVDRQLQNYGEQLFQLADDEYLMFGDNSPASKDSRLFDHDSRPLRGIHSNRYAVREQDLIGEALWIFWPHGIPFLNGGRGYAVLDHKKYTGDNRIVKDTSYPLYSVPFYPNVSRMKRIR